jgi:Helix-turn-helix domain
MSRLPTHTDTELATVGVSRYAQQNAAPATAAALLVTLRSFRGPRGIVASVEAIARDIGMSERTVQRARAMLVRAGALVVRIQGGPQRSTLWHESRTNEYVIVGETRRERRWRRPYYVQEKQLTGFLAPYLSARPTLIDQLRFLIARAVDNNEYFDPVELIEGCQWSRGRRHQIAASGFCVWCAERII